MINDQEKLWFKRKLYGWGWTPVTWQGWLTTIVFILSSLLFALQIEPTATVKDVVIVFFLPEAILLSIFMVIAYKKGERPRWQWGERKDDSTT